ncbi:hypothetical protein J2Z83_000210 [Virgibacillus natechei]|uniref:Flagellar hook-length control protein-like C-terminal domain-containing protein n=1 Tax=Virgibacillus natechei TaxID=1216297 RepID=A0ABS4IB09_9BACI|nr:hypothetical protein [Virgibacillus natechei]MBP1968118.1 hypothetical protein [Virgibacillus natechei]UZD14603.1 hypothetical protein OLD84_08950 [Virgibacillus natechei]
MSVYQVNGKRLTAMNHSQLTLRPGQIIQGKILKLYPDNKAQIQLGSEKMIAQLEASLTTSGKYHFQVQTTDQIIHLKVLGEQLKNQERANVTHLMQQLGLKINKSNTALMQTLINEKIPFEKNQLVQAFRLLDGSQNKKEAQQVLKDMITNKLPITDSVFQALSMRSFHSLSEQMKASLEQLKQHTNHTQLLDRMSQMVERPLDTKSAIVNQITTEIRANSQQFFNILKAAGALEPQKDFTSWKSQWGSFIKQMNGSTQRTATVELPVQLNDLNLVRALEKLATNKDELLRHSQQILHTWSNKMTGSFINNVSLEREDFAQLKQQISENVLPLLTNHQQQQYTHLLQNNPVQLRQLLFMLQTIATDQIYAKTDQFLGTMNQDKAFMLAAPREQFLTQVNQTLLFTGLSYENQLANDNIQQQSVTVKGMLMQLFQQSESALSHDRSQQLLHFINGMQLQSVNESAHLLQANLQIPGERLGLPKDLELNFEGRKTEKGEINPDHCRILFYLDLTHLKKTVIDMNVQKRAVAVTIFNDFESIKEQSLFLKPMLKTGLENLNYQLTTISFKPLQQLDKPKKTTGRDSFRADYQGVDYRI